MDTYQLPLPTDPDYVRQWHLHRHFSHPAFDLRSTTDCEQAWQILDHFGSPDVVIGLTDDGCRLDHPDFDSPGKFAGWGYFRGTRLITNVDIDADPDEMYKSGANHGTSCAGVIAGEVDALLTAGASPGCRLLPIQWESSGSSLFISDSKLLTALNFIADKVDVLSNSWGSVPINTWVPPVVNRISQLAQNGGRHGRGIAFLWAAGNENCPIQHNADMDIPFTNGWQIHPDGSATWVGVSTARHFRNNLVGIPGLMHVAALASNARRSHYSNYGTGIMLCAPTSNSHRYHRLSVVGLGVTTTTGSVGGVTDSFGGTSSATPLVAGIAALVLSANPDLSALDVVSILKRTASKDLGLEGYPRTPPAIFDSDTGWDVSPIAPFDRGDFIDNGDPDGTWSPWFGHGRVNAVNAVNEALSRKTPPPEENIHKVSKPGLDIPDNDPGGVQDTITIDDTLRVGSIKVTVDIQHTFIGDLRVRLSSPSGIIVVLHDRQGGSANNIRRTYDLQTSPGLGALLDEPVQGNWILRVQDLAARDTGRLKQWELDIDVGSGMVVVLEEFPGTIIPDNKPEGIQRQLETDEEGQIKEVEVSIDITHTYIGDLVVTLVSPDGIQVPLHQRTGRGTDNLITTYTPATKPGLQGLRGEEIKGAWQLKVADLAGLDTGKLNRWGLHLAREV
jgi:subtilisin-like proprotein convertase family protein